MKGEWSKGIVKVCDSPDLLALSVVFTWDLPAARAICLQETQRRVLVGGPAVRLQPGFLEGCGDIGSDWPGALQQHNPAATRTTVGCPNRCPYCAVPATEGAFRELDSWPVGRIVIDNNLLAASRRHFSRVVQSLRRVRGVDLQTLDARLLTPWHAEQLRVLWIGAAHLSWDRPGDEEPVLQALETLHRAGVSKRHLGVYCLINHGESPDEALYRMETLKAAGYKGFPMRYQPLDTLAYNSYVAPEWSEFELRRFVRYWSRQGWFMGIPYREYSHCQRSLRGQSRLF